MATLYLENVPDDLYEALRKQARQHQKSIAAEVVALLEENIPTAKELKARKDFLARVLRLRSRRRGSKGRFSSAERTLREDRAR